MVLPHTKGLSVMEYHKKKTATDETLMFLYADDAEVHRSGSDREVLVNEDLQNFASNLASSNKLILNERSLS